METVVVMLGQSIADERHPRKQGLKPSSIVRGDLHVKTPMSVIQENKD